MDFDDRNKVDGADGENNKPDDKTEGKPRRISRGHYYNPLVYYKGNKGKTYYYQYFKPYSYDFRMLQNDEKGDPIECLCPRGKVHFTTCPWYNPDIIYILDTKGDLSTSEQAAQQKIYQMYQNTLNNPPESCGCGTAAEIAYMGHNTGCIEFLHLHERESYEVLLAILKKRKKVTFYDDTVVEQKRAKLDSTVEATGKDDVTGEIPEVQNSTKSKINPTQSVTGNNRCLCNIS